MSNNGIDLGAGYRLAPAGSYAEFARFSALYRAAPGPLSGDNLYCAQAPCLFVYKDGARVAGCLLSDAEIAHLFLIPPFEARAELTLRLCAHLTRRGSGIVYALDVMQSELNDYFRAGFRLCAELAGSAEAARVEYSLSFCAAMLRPTERLSAALPAGFTAGAPQKRQRRTIAELLLRAYAGGDPHRGELADFLCDIDEFFDLSPPECRRASRALYKDGRLVGCCLIAFYDGLPLVFDIAVDPEARGGGGARYMLSHAINALDGKHPYLRLFVEQGNPAQALYHSMGFVAGPATTTLYKRV